MPDNKLKQFHDYIKGNPNISGVPNDFNTFQSVLKDPSKSKAFFDAISKNQSITGIPKDYNTFASSLGIVEKKNPNTPTASSGTANSTVSKPNPAFKTLDYGEIINKVREVDINERKAIKQAKATSIAVENTAPLLKALPKPIQSGAIDIGTGVTGLVGGLMEMAAKSPRWAVLGGKSDADKIMDFAMSMQEASNSIMVTSKSESGIEDSGKSSFEHLTDGNLSDFGKSITRDVGRVIPQTVATVFSGGSTAVLSTLGAVSAGNALTGEYTQDQDISITDMAQSVAKGAVEAVLSKVFNMDILAGNVIKKGMVSKLDDILNAGGQVLKQKIKEEGKEAVLGQLIRSNKDIALQGVKGGFQNALEEDTNTLLSFIVDAIDEDKFNKESFDQLINGLGNTTLTSMATGAPISLLAAKISQKPLTTDEKKTIESLNSILQNPEISNETRNIIQRKIADINKGINDESLNNLSKVSNMNTEDKMSILFEQEQVSKLENDVKSITDVDLKDEMLAEIERRKQGVSDIINKDFYTFEYSKESDIPSELKDKVSSVSEVNGKKTYRITLPKSQANFILNNLNNSKNSNEAEQAKTKTEAEQAVLGETPEETFYTGRGKKYDDLKNTKGEFIFFSKDPKISEWYGGDESNVSEAKLDTSDFLDLTTQESKTKFVKEHFTDKDIEKLYSDEIKYEEDTDRFGRKTRESLIKKYRERAEENRFSGDGKEQQFLLKKIKEQGHSGVKLLDTHFGKSDISYVVIDKSKIEQSLKETPKAGSVGVAPDGQLSSSGTPIEQNIETLPNEAGVGQEPQQTQHEQVTGGEEITGSGVLQAQEAVKPENPEQAWTKSKVMMENQEQMLMDMNKKSSGWNNFVKKWFERQINVVKAMGNTPEAQKAKDQMTVVAGARSAADETFKNSEKEIYKGLSLEEEKNLDHLLFHKRVVQIDSNYDTKGKDRIKHPMGFNKEDSEMAIEGMKKEIGEEKFNKLSESADKYFQKQNEILQRLKEGELIDEDTYDRLKDDDYIKRVFIDHLNDSPENRTKALGDYGLKPRQIQALDEGSEGLLLMDSRQLLNAAYRSAEQRVFQNRANQALSDVIKIQTDMGKELKVWNNKNTGKPEFEHAQKGHTRVVYFVDGKPRAFQLKDNLYNEWMDMEKRTTELDSLVRTFMGTAVLKSMATGINATFAITNTPADYLNVILATDTYDRTNVFNAAQKLARSFASNFAQLSLLNSTGVGSKNFKSLSDDFIKYGGGLEFLTTYGKPDDLVKRDKRYSMIGRAIRGTADTTVKALAFTGEQSERAMRLSVFNEVRNQAVKDAGGRDKITQKQWDDISYMAAAKARRTMDFAKGGLWSKKLDNVSPYFNASAQGTRVAAEYIYKNPKKFASKWAQISSAVAALTLYNAMVGDDEDWENIPDYEKNNYFIVFSPQKHINKKGEEVRGYWRWKKTPALAPFLNLSEAGTMAAYNQMTGRNFGAKDETLKREWDAINDALPIPIDPTQLPNKMSPVPKAALSYFANYDFYRKQKLVTGVEEDILPQYQGLSDEKIPAIYKKIGEFSSKMSQDMAISPKKLQKATEMIITNPQTNAILGGAYGILDLMVNKFSDVPENWKNTDQEISTIFGGAKARMYREINPNYKLLQDNSLKKIEKELETKNVVIRNEIRDMIENEKSESDVKTFLKGKEGFSNEEKETLYKYYKNVREDKKLQREIPSFYKLAPLKYWSKGSPEDKARILAINIGIMDPKSEEFRDVLRDMDKMGISVSDRFINGYQEIYRQTLENK